MGRLQKGRLVTDTLTITILAFINALGIGALIREYLIRKKTVAETDSIEADAKLKLAKADSIAVESANQIMSQVMTLSNSKDLRIGQLTSDITYLRNEIDNLSANWNKVRVVLAAHGQWDLHVVALVRTIQPDFPDPPPLYAITSDMLVEDEHLKNVKD